MYISKYLVSFQDNLNDEQLLYLNMDSSQIKLWKLEKFENDIESEELEFQVQTKDELRNNLLYFRTCMKLELDRKVNDCDSSYITSLLEKKVPMFIKLKCIIITNSYSNCFRLV